MKELIEEFLEEGRLLRCANPVDFFPDPSETKKNEGIVPIFYIRWAYFKGLMNVEGEDFRGVFLKKIKIKKKLKLIRDILGGALLPSFFSKEGAAFTIKYYNTGWKYFYINDFCDCFPDCEEIEDFPDTPESYRLVEAVLNKRFDEWVSEL